MKSDGSVLKNPRRGFVNTFLAVGFNQWRKNPEFRRTTGVLNNSKCLNSRRIYPMAQNPEETIVHPELFDG
jgi:hypothetical protein